MGGAGRVGIGWAGRVEIGWAGGWLRMGIEMKIGGWEWRWGMGVGMEIGWRSDGMAPRLHARLLLVVVSIAKPGCSEPRVVDETGTLRQWAHVAFPW